MKCCEFDVYSSVYCGLCKELGKNFGLFSRLTLSYDFTFIAILKMAVNNEKQSFAIQPCLFNPLKKKLCCASNTDLSHVASIAMTMLYYKILDNFEDTGLKDKTLSYLLYPFTKGAYKKVYKQNPIIGEIILQATQQQQLLEQQQCDSVDKACEPTALALSKILKTFSQDATEQRVLERLGYLIGRFVYMADALDDIRDDIKKMNYNVFVIRNNKQEIPNTIDDMTQSITDSLYQTVSEIADTYALLTIYDFKPILDNIIHLGFINSIDLIKKKYQDMTQAK